MTKTFQIIDKASSQRAQLIPISGSGTCLGVARLSMIHHSDTSAYAVADQTTYDTLDHGVRSLVGTTAQKKSPQTMSELSRPSAGAMDPVISTAAAGCRTISGGPAASCLGRQGRGAGTFPAKTEVATTIETLFSDVRCCVQIFLTR